jgi:hypothetical protein
LPLANLPRMMLGYAAPLPDAPRVVLDSNALDVLCQPRLFTSVRQAVEQGRLVLMWTHITIDELAAIPDAHKRGQLLTLGSILTWFVPTGSFVIEYSRLDAARLGDKQDSVGVEAFRRGRLKETADALIGATAVFERARIATRDARLIKSATARGVEIVDPEDLPSLAAGTSGSHL